jgi:hypothetical protein
MLRSNENPNWLGIDMRPLWRRRVAVVISYVFFIAATGGILAIDQSWGHSAWVSIVLLGLAWQLGVFSFWGPLKRFQLPTPSNLPGHVFVNGLDDLACYRYGVANYEAANETQKSDLLQTYHVGLRTYPRKPEQAGQAVYGAVRSLNDRERDQLLEAMLWARRMLFSVVPVLLLPYFEKDFVPERLAIVTTLIWLLIWITTGPAARILCTEADPRRADGEQQLSVKNPESALST